VQHFPFVRVARLLFGCSDLGRVFISHRLHSVNRTRQRVWHCLVCVLSTCGETTPIKVDLVLYYGIQVVVSGQGWLSCLLWLSDGYLGILNFFCYGTQKNVKLSVRQVRTQTLLLRIICCGTGCSKATESHAATVTNIFAQPHLRTCLIPRSSFIPAVVPVNISENSRTSQAETEAGSRTSKGRSKPSREGKRAQVDSKTRGSVEMQSLDEQPSDKQQPSDEQPSGSDIPLEPTSAAEAELVAQPSAPVPAEASAAEDAAANSSSEMHAG
jgi:hypothetical protein